MGNFNKEIHSPIETNEQTWNDCPECGKAWKDKFPTPGLLHRTRLCHECIEEIIDNLNDDKINNG